MREIKFRAWHRPSHLMVQGVSHVQPDSYIVMQYTGLKDKNGVEIYEGDLLDIESAGGDRGYVPVVFRDASFMMHIPYWVNDYYHLSNYDSNLYEVIGNIYEHPELLNDNNQ